jgi:carbon monoxide dehydrogenase subunit G
MELEHSFTVPVPLDRAWDVLLDVERVAPCMPGATVTSVDGDVVHATVKVKVGPISMTYAGTARFVEKDKAAGVVLLEASGKETKGSGTASAKIRSVLTDGGNETHVTVQTTLNVTGRPAQFGRGVMSEVSGKLLTLFAANLAALLSEPEGATIGSENTTGAVGPQATTAPAATPGAAAVDRPAADADTEEAVAGVAAVVGAGAEAGLRAELDESIDELKLPTRVVSSLRREGLATVGQLTGRTEEQLLAIEGIGLASVKEIRTKLGERGLALGRPQGVPGASQAASNGAVGVSVPDATTDTAGTGSANGSTLQGGSLPSTAEWEATEFNDNALNLLRVAGLPILKRALPVLAGLAAIALVGLRARYRHRRQRD